MFKELKTVSDLNKVSILVMIDYSIVADEFDSLVRSLNKVGVKVFLADMRYFPIGHRGVYHTVGNNFFECCSYASSWYYDVSDASRRLARCSGLYGG